MKKLNRSILVFCLIVTSILFTACGRKDNTTKDNATPTPIIGEEPTNSPNSTSPSTNNGANTNGTGTNTSGTNTNGVNTDGTNSANSITNGTAPNSNTANSTSNGANSVVGLDGTNGNTSTNNTNGNIVNPVNTDMASSKDGSMINSTTSGNAYTRYNRRNGEYTVRPSYIEGDNQLVYALTEMVGESDNTLVSTFGTGIINQSEEEKPMLISREYMGELYDQDVIITAMFGDNQTIDEFVIYFEEDDDLADIKREMIKDFGQAKDVLDTTNTKSVKDKSEKATYRATWEIDGTQVALVEAYNSVSMTISADQLNER